MTAVVNVNDLVLLGTPKVAMPSDWWLGRVLWVGQGDILVEQYGIGGQRPHRHLHGIDMVRAVGTGEELLAAKERARIALADLTKRVSACEAALREARDDVWRELDAMATIGGAAP